MDAEDKSISISRIVGLLVDFLFIVVPIAMTITVVGIVTLVLLPEFSVAVVGAAAILGAVRWLNSRDDEFRAKRYTQVPQ